MQRILADELVIFVVSSNERLNERVTKSVGGHLEAVRRSNMHIVIVPVPIAIAYGEVIPVCGENRID